MKGEQGPYVAFRDDRLRLIALLSRQIWEFAGIVVICHSGLPSMAQAFGLALYIASARTCAHLWTQ